MLDKFAKLEAAINKVLTLILNKLMIMLSLLIPKLVKDYYFKGVIKFQLFMSHLKSKTVENSKNLYSLVKTFVNSVFDKINDIQKYPIKDKASELILRIKIYLLSHSLRDHFKIAIKKSKELIREIIKKIPKREETPPYGLWAILSLTIILGSFGVYFSANKIYQKEYPYRKIASVQEYDDRPEYRMYEQKTIHIRNVKLPIFVESLGEINSITIDFSVRTSTRFARYFLEEYEYKLKDYFFTGMEPIISDFPIEHEGKDVVKEVIIQEINLFLEDNHVEGEVEEVNILYLIGS